MGGAEKAEDKAGDEPAEGYPLRVVTRLTGLKAELLRAWESRYEAIRPNRTRGGARRYSTANLDRLRLLRDAVAAGHRIGTIAGLDDRELEALLAASTDRAVDSIGPLLDAAERLDAAAVRKRVLDELANRDLSAFTQEFAIPLLVEIGTRWESGRSSISAEHLTSTVLRGVLLNLLVEADPGQGRPQIVFATPEGESHDLGTLMAALVAARSGASLAFLGADIPSGDLAEHVIESGASVLALGLVAIPAAEAEESIRALRRRLPDRIRVWVGGAGALGIAPMKGVQRITGLGQVEAEVAHLDLRSFPSASSAASRPGREATS